MFVTLWTDIFKNVAKILWTDIFTNVAKILLRCFTLFDIDVMKMVKIFTEMPKCDVSKTLREQFVIWRGITTVLIVFLRTFTKDVLKTLFRYVVGPGST